MKRDPDYHADDTKLWEEWNEPYKDPDDYPEPEEKEEFIPKMTIGEAQEILGIDRVKYPSGN